MSKKMAKNDSVDDMSFVDFYYDDDDVLYPEIRKALGELTTKLRQRRPKLMRAQKQGNEDFYAPYYKKPVTRG